MNALTDIFPAITRKWMNFGYSFGVAALGVWAAVLAALEQPLPGSYKAAAAAWLAIGGYLGLQSGSNVNTDDIDTVDGSEPDLEDIDPETFREDAPAPSPDE